MTEDSLREALDTLERVSTERHDPDICQCRSVARKSVESLFGRIKEERDRAITESERLVRAQIKDDGEIRRYRAELGRIREELKEALAEVDRLHALSLRLRA